MGVAGTGTLRGTTRDSITDLGIATFSSYPSSRLARWTGRLCYSVVAMGISFWFYNAHAWLAIHGWFSVASELALSFLTECCVSLTRFCTARWWRKVSTRYFDIRKIRRTEWGGWAGKVVSLNPMGYFTLSLSIYRDKSAFMTANSARAILQLVPVIRSSLVLVTCIQSLHALFGSR